VLRVERTFMAPEYGSTPRKDAITSFSTSNAIVGPNFEEFNPFNSGLDHVRSYFRARGDSEIVRFN